MKELFNKRPIWTRRALEFHLGENHSHHLKTVIHYVSYTIQNGPWRDAVVKFGVDTRFSPEYRIYQTRRFRYNLQKVGEKYDSHLPYQFDGVHLMTGSVVQFCDITDPDIRTIIDNGKIRKSIDKEAGWFESIDYQRIKTLLYFKYKTISEKSSLEGFSMQKISNASEDPSLTTL